MRHFLVDASALGKRYAPEPGTPLINQLFSTVPSHRILVLTHTIAETFSIAVRRKNAGTLSTHAFRRAWQVLHHELVLASGIRLLSTDDARVITSLPLIERHSLNATDALILRSALDEAVVLRQSDHDLILVASDLRLLRAAIAEGLDVLNPETDMPARVAQLAVG